MVQEELIDKKGQLKYPKAKKQLEVGRKDKVECPYCNNVVELCFTKNGKKLKKCKKCEREFVVVVIMPPTLEVARGLPQKGKIRVLRRWWIPKEFALRNGINVIGRADKNYTPDIVIGGDNSISRRALVIDVIKRDIGYFFELNVLKNTNEVLHNNVIISEGEKVSLNYGDIIVVGRTKLKFVK